MAEAKWCNKCNNTGYVVKEQTCSECNGSGFCCVTEPNYRYPKSAEKLLTNKVFKCKLCTKGQTHTVRCKIYDTFLRDYRITSLQAGTGKMKVSVPCICNLASESQVVAVPKVAGKPNVLFESGIFGLKFGSIVTNKVFTLKKPWRGKYTDIEVGVNSANKMRMIRVIWNFDTTAGYRPSETELSMEIAALCKIFKSKYDFDVPYCNGGVMTTWRSDGWYVGISYVDRNRLFFDISCERIPVIEPSEDELDGIDDL